MAHAQLWSNRLDGESVEEELRNDLETMRTKLHNALIEGETLKQALDTEKQNNVQLVHYKVKNMDRVEALKKDVALYDTFGDVNVTELLRTLEIKHAELEELRNNNDQLEKATEEGVRIPAKQIGAIRRKIQKMKKASVNPEEEVIDKIDFKRVIAENEQIKRINELMKVELVRMEEVKEKKACDVREYMESTCTAPPPMVRPGVKASGIIIKPMMKTRPPLPTFGFLPL
jgi:tRNA U34 5-carboxymethylaminomethyl modifying enzyme MnmG/GidA